MKTKFIDVAGTPTRCLYAGDEKAFPILLIHGRALMAEVWLRNIDVLGRDFFVVAPDVLGNGFTGPVTFGDEPAIGTRLKHLMTLVDTLGWRQFCACGSSHGALLATNMYLRMPDRVSRLVLNGSAACSSPDDKLATLMATTLQKDANIGESTLEEWHRRCGKGMYDPSGVPPELPAMLMTSYAQPWIRRAWHDSLISQMDVKSIRDFRILHRLDQFHVDTLVTWGRQDHGAPYENGVAMVKAMPRARLDTYDWCGHMPMLEHPEKFNTTVRAFVRDGLG